MVLSVGPLSHTFEMRFWATFSAVSRKRHFSKFSVSLACTRKPQNHAACGCAVTVPAGGAEVLVLMLHAFMKSYRKTCPPYYVASLTAEIFSMFIKRLISTKTVLLFSRALLVFEFTFCSKTSFFVFNSSYLLIFDKICMLLHIRWHQVIAIYLIFQDKISNFPAPSCDIGLCKWNVFMTCPWWQQLPWVKNEG